MKTLAVSLLLLLSFVLPAKAQTGPAQGDHELELWTGGGHSVGGGIGGISAWNVGLRYGWILTSPHGPGILRGQFEYAVDVVPVFWLFEPKGTAYGFVLDPIALKWDFRERGRVVPYFELSGGTLFTSRDVPPGILVGELRLGRRSGLLLPGQEAHLERGASFYTHFGCGVDDSESRHQHDPGAVGL